MPLTVFPHALSHCPSSDQRVGREPKQQHKQQHKQSIQGCLSHVGCYLRDDEGGTQPQVNTITCTPNCLTPAPGA
jgi:hypothetical protein